MSHKLAIILGTCREGAYSQKVAKHIANIAANTYSVTLIDPSTSEYAIKNDHQVSEKYKQVLKEAEGIILVFPEYNHSYPGTLKSLLDAAFSEYTLKPFLLVGVSDGIFGGVRAVEAVLPILKKFGGYPLQKDIYVTEVDKKLDEHGLIIDPSLLDTINKRLAQLETLIQKFNIIRD